LIKVVPLVRNMLSAAQMRKLGFVAQFMDPRYLAYVRSGTASGGGGIGIPIGADMMMSAGSGSFVIIR
jgi:hypothetical protein